MATKASTEVSDEYRDSILQLLPQIQIREQWAANVFGYWMAKLPLDPELDRLRFKLAKSAYDEMRHREILEEVIEHFGGQQAVEEVHRSWDPWNSWHTTMTRVFTDGMMSPAEFLTTVPMLGDRAGFYTFSDFAECSPDPVWADAAESIVEDEKLHVSLADEFLPVFVDRHGDEAIDHIERAIDTWVPALFGIQGHPEIDADGRNHLIESGVMTLTTQEAHELMWEEMYNVIDPLGIEVPPLDEIDIVPAGEVEDYCLDVYQERTVKSPQYQL